jgi:hypothetical protein
LFGRLAGTRGQRLGGLPTGRIERTADVMQRRWQRAQQMVLRHLELMAGIQALDDMDAALEGQQGFEQALIE